MNSVHDHQKQYWSKSKHAKRRSPAHPVVQCYVEPKLDYIWNHLNQNVTSILDVGAGNGYFSMYLDRRAPTTAVDYSDVMLEGNPVRNKLEMDARHMTFENNSFDLVFCHAVLHHIALEDQICVVREMARVSKKYVVLIEPNRNHPLMCAFGLLKSEEHGLLRFSHAYTRSLCTAADLQIIDSCTFGCLTPNRMPIPQSCLEYLKRLEKPLSLGIVSIVIAEK